jgi:hypothetical protein
MEALRSQLVAAHLAAMEANAAATAATARLERVASAAAAMLPATLPAPLAPRRSGQRASSSCGGCAGATGLPRPRRSGSATGFAAGAPPRLAERKPGMPAALSRQLSAPSHYMVFSVVAGPAVAPAAIEAAIASAGPKQAHALKVERADALDAPEEGDWRIAACCDAPSEGGSSEAAAPWPAAAASGAQAGGRVSCAEVERESHLSAQGSCEAQRQQADGHEQGPLSEATYRQQQQMDAEAFSYAAILKRAPAAAHPPRSVGHRSGGGARRLPAAGPKTSKRAGSGQQARPGAMAVRAPFLKVRQGGKEAGAVGLALGSDAAPSVCPSDTASSARPSDAASSARPSDAASSARTSESGTTARSSDSAASASSSEAGAAAAVEGRGAPLQQEDGWQEGRGRRRSQQRRLRRQQQGQSGPEPCGSGGAAEAGAGTAMQAARPGMMCLSPRVVEAGAGSRPGAAAGGARHLGVLQQICASSPRGGAAERAAWHDSVCRGAAAGAVVCALEDSEGAGGDWCARRERLLLRHGQERMAALAAEALEARAQLEGTPGSILAPGTTSAEAGGLGYGPLEVAAAARAVAAAAVVAGSEDDGDSGGGGGAAGERYLQWAVRVASQQAELGVVIEVRRRGPSLAYWLCRLTLGP